MRLINADLLKKNCKCTGGFDDNFKCVNLIELAKVIDNQPTVDAAPVVHGRWEWLGPYCGNNDGLIGTCSVCKKRLRVFEKDYCPNCGAKMDLEVERMTEQEAIKYVESRMRSGCTKDEVWQAGDIAIKAINKQIPKQVAVHVTEEDIKVGNAVFGKGVKTYRCACGRLVLLSSRYCPDCGQKLDWEGEA